MGEFNNIGMPILSGGLADFDRRSAMAWTEPEYSREEINASGKMLVKSILDMELDEWDKYYRAIDIINHYRACHSYPLNTFQTNLRRYARRVSSNAIVAQRTKRLSSIEAKLKRFPKMKLSQMQDLGGCRAVLPTIDDVQTLVSLYAKSSIKHERASFDDYIAEPQKTGYRGVHIVFRYVSDKNRKMFNGLKIEIQLRSIWQHAWATAVETVGTFVGQALKSSVGEEQWLRFFALMGAAIAYREKSPTIPGVPDSQTEVVAELKHLSEILNVGQRLRAYGNAMKSITQQTILPDSHYYLLRLNPVSAQLIVSGFRSYEFERASKAYADAEMEARKTPGTDAVLVSVDSVSALERAYPNYFADTRIFLQLMDQAISGHTARIQVPAPSSASSNLSSTSSNP